jgi:hypothetical protein
LSRIMSLVLHFTSTELGSPHWWVHPTVSDGSTIQGSKEAKI